MCATCAQLDPFNLTDLAAVMHPDLAHPAPQRDVVAGDDGANMLMGTAGNDDIFGGAGTDTLYGEAGDDQIYGGADDDVVYGGAGNDTFHGALAYQDTIDGGTGIDTLDLSDSTTVFANSGTFVLDIDQGVSINNGVTFIDGNYSNLENVISFSFVAIEIIGNAADNHLTASIYDDTIRGEDGNDMLFGRDGADNLYGDAGEDILIGGAGIDRLYGGADNDHLIVHDGTGADDLFGGSGDDTADFSDFASADMVFNTYSQTYAFGAGGASHVLNSIEVILAGGGDDTFVGSNAFRYAYDGGAGVDTLDISSGAYNLPSYGNYVLDIDQGFSTNGGTTFLYGDFSNLENVTSFARVAIKLIGNSADNVLTASIYDDVLQGEFGKDTLYGGEGNDKLYGGADADRLFGGNGNDVLDGNSGADFLAAWNGDDVLFGRGGVDHLRGQGGEDILNGGDGKDRLEGGGQADVIFGGNGRDKLFGGNGRDTLDGGVGNDLYNGGVGSDTFVFSGNFGDDRIQDFDATDNSEDIDLSGVASITGWADLSNPANGHLFVSGSDVMIDDLAGNTIRLVGVNIADLDANDFLF